MYKPSATLIVSKAIVCATSVPLWGTFIAETTNSVSLPVDTLCNFTVMFESESTSLNDEDKFAFNAIRAYLMADFPPFETSSLTQLPKRSNVKATVKNNLIDVFIFICFLLIVFYIFNPTSIPK